jgi:hypothetical protein
MSDKDLQRVTKCVSYIGHASMRRSLPTRRHITQKITVQCHELFRRRLAYDRGRTNSGRLCTPLSYLFCNGDSLHSPGERFPAISSYVPRPANHSLASPSDRQRSEPPEEERRRAVAMSSFIGGP